MKKTHFLVATIGLLALGLTSCGGSQTAEETPVTYSLNTASSSLKWDGNYLGDGHSHSGTVSVTEGTVVYNGDTFESGDFTIDMASITSTDLPSPDKDTLDVHLSGPYFFQSANFPASTVKIKSVTEKEVMAEVTVLGKKIETTLPIKMTKKADKITAKGKFEMDLTPAGIGGFLPQDATKPNEHVNPVIKFDLNLVLDAGK